MPPIARRIFHGPGVCADDVGDVFMLIKEESKTPAGAGEPHAATPERSVTGPSPLTRAPRCYFPEPARVQKESGDAGDSGGPRDDGRSSSFPASVAATASDIG